MQDFKKGALYFPNEENFPTNFKNKLMGPESRE